MDYEHRARNPGEESRNDGAKKLKMATKENLENITQAAKKDNEKHRQKN